MNVKEYNQRQTLLFPPHLKDFLPDDHPAMIINDIVETLDLSCLYRKIPSEGNPSYHPKMMLKILVYAYANGIFSSRKIQAAVQESVAFIFLAAWHKPDFRTISDFRKHNLAEFRTLFNQVVNMCKRLGMISLGHVAIDGRRVGRTALRNHPVAPGRHTIVVENPQAGLRRQVTVDLAAGESRRISVDLMEDL